VAADPLAALLALDVAAVLSGLGSAAVACGAKRARGLLDVHAVEERDAEGYPVAVRRPVLRVPAGSLGAPKRDAAVTVGAARYKLLSIEPDDGDGAVEVLVLRRDA
jgi:hypothetical protein